MVTNKLHLYRIIFTNYNQNTLVFQGSGKDIWLFQSNLENCAKIKT